jgi:hypothetical protein
MSARDAFVAAYSGRLRDARDISHRAVFQAQQAGQPERASLWAVGAAVRETLFGNKEAAVEWAASALQLSRTREVAYGAALAFAMSGDSPQAQALADEMEKGFPEDSSVRFSYVPTIRAVLALNRAEPQHAVELLQAAAPHELGIPLSAVSGLFGALYPVYVRGQAYLAAIKQEAAAEFRQILDHRHRRERSHRGSLSPPVGQGICAGGRQGESAVRLSGFFQPLERRRSGHPRTEAG